MTAVFLQARVNSSRLSRKVLLKLGDRTVLEHAMRALDTVPADVHCIVTSQDSVDELAVLSRSAGWEIFVGPMEDVLLRYCLAAGKYRASWVVRATGDNPLVSGKMASEALNMGMKADVDYAGFTGLPLGCGVEAVRVSALEEAEREAVDPYEREHVTPFLYRRPRRYSLLFSEAPPPFRLPESRVTLDTEEDYRFLQTLFDDLYKGDVLELDDLISYLAEREKDAG